MKLHSMEHESCIKFDRVVRLKSLFFLEFHETQFRIEHVLFYTTCSMKINDSLTCSQWKSRAWGHGIIVIVCKDYSVDVRKCMLKKSKLDKEWTSDE